jgi:general stress protein 26
MSISEKYQKIAAYINDNPITTLGTLGPDNMPHGAVVYICPDEEQHIVYFLTKNQTQKYTNIQASPNVSLTIVNPDQNSTLQANGTAFTVKDSHALDMVTRRMVTAKPETSAWLPPVSTLEAGQYVVVGIKIVHARLAEFDKMELSHEDIFTEV